MAGAVDEADVAVAVGWEGVGGRAWWKGRRGGGFEGKLLVKDPALREYASSQFTLVDSGVLSSTVQKTDHRTRLKVV